ncbi:hypothetical protein Tco_0038165 [Tanacetum coccineum]
MSLFIAEVSLQRVLLFEEQTKCASCVKGDCHMDFIKLGWVVSRVLSDLPGEGYGKQKRVLAGFGIEREEWDKKGIKLGCGQESEDDIRDFGFACTRKPLHIFPLVILFFHFLSFIN